jgi:hypothetical protein
MWLEKLFRETLDTEVVCSSKNDERSKSSILYIYEWRSTFLLNFFFFKDDLIFTIFFLVNFPFYFLMSHCFLIFAFILVCIYNLFFIIATPKANPPLSTKTKHQIFFLILQLYSLFTFLHLFFHLYSFCWTTKHSVITFWFSFIPIFLQPVKSVFLSCTFRNFHYSFYCGVLWCGASAWIAERCRADPPQTLCS